MPVQDRPLAVCLKGPTAAGKTAIALELVRELPMQIISVDSAMVYRQMDIGTAKPGPEALAAAPHELIDIRDPWEAYSAGQFRRDAGAAMRRVTAAGKVPLLVGGTMLYFRALQAGLADLPGPDPELRAEIDQRAAEFGWGALHRELQELDAEAAARIKATDTQRIQRALEVCLLTGARLSDLQRETAADDAYRYLDIGLVPGDRAGLHTRIEQRFSQMMAAGFAQEVAGLLKHPRMSPAAVSLRAVGYRQLCEHFSGQIELDEAERKAVVATRRLAKRQLTWLRAEEGNLQVDCLAENVAEQVRRIIDESADFSATFAVSG